MPNHVTHRIVCEGPVRDVAAFQELMIVEKGSDAVDIFKADGGELSDDEARAFRTKEFDFNRIIPMPPILRKVISPARLGENGRVMLVDNPDDWTNRSEREATQEEHDEIMSHRIDLGFGLASALWKDSSIPDWYQFATTRWGTKWNSYGFQEVEDKARYEFTFDTAWSPPEPVFAELVERFPSLKFDVAWFDEGWMHAGNGQIGFFSPKTRMDDVAVEPTAEVYAKVYGDYPEEYEEEPIYDLDNEDMRRIAFNGYSHDVASVSDEQGYYPVTSVIYSDDKEFDDEDLRIARNYRNFMRGQLLPNTV